MKKIKFAIICAFIAFIAISCIETNKPTFNSALLIGKWRQPSALCQDGSQGYLYYRFDTGGSGATWDTADDVSETEAQSFTWTLSGATLNVVYQGQMGQVIPKSYTLKTLNSTTLSYTDNYGTRYTYMKYTGN